MNQSPNLAHSGGTHPVLAGAEERCWLLPLLSLGVARWRPTQTVRLPPSGQNVDIGKLQEGGEHKEQAGGHPHVYSLDVGHPWERGSSPGSLSGHRQN